MNTSEDRAFDPNNVTWYDDKVTAKNRLLYIGKRIIELPEADRVARKYGFYCAEQLVKAMGGYEK